MGAGSKRGRRRNSDSEHADDALTASQRRNEKKYHALLKEHSYALVRYTITMNITDLLKYTISFTVSQIVSKEIQKVEHSKDGLWWDVLSMGSIAFVSLCVLCIMSIIVSGVERRVTRIKEALMHVEHEMNNDGL
jgi:hypothetical protein